MDVGLLLASRLGLPPFAEPVLAEPAPLPAPAAPPIAAWIQDAVRAVSVVQRSGRAERAWPVLRVLEPLVPALAERDPASAGRVIGVLATQALLEGDVEAFLDRARRAAEAFERAGDPGAAAFERATLGAAYRVLGTWDEAERALLAAIAAPAADPGVAARARLDLALVTVARGSGTGARALAEEAAAAFAREGDVAGEGVARAGLAGILAATGDGVAALDEARRATRLLAGSAGGRAFAGASLARALLVTGDVEGALAAAEPALGEAVAAGRLKEGEVNLLLVLADARLAAGDPGGAAAAINEGRRGVLADAARLGDPAIRRAFLGQVPEHRRVLEG